MKAIVVFESHWGNTATVARAIAAGIGNGTLALSTAQATPAVCTDLDLIVAGAPLLAFSLPTEATLKGMANNQGRDAAPPDLSSPALRTWLETLPGGHGHSASFETRIWWSPGSAAKSIERAMARLGYSPITKSQRFIVKGKYGPLKDGELERARMWGAELARSLG